MSRISAESGIGIGVGLGLGMFAPFGDGALWGGVCPQVPLHLRRGGHLGLFKVWPLRGRNAPEIGALVRDQTAKHQWPLRDHSAHRSAYSYLRGRLVYGYLRAVCCAAVWCAAVWCMIVSGTGWCTVTFGVAWCIVARRFARHG